jgi:glycosyltransferase involved in cell wall biosynthesis
MNVTAIVITRDRPALLRDALASIAAQTQPPFEVLVGDDGTTPLSPTELPAAPSTTIVRCGGNSAASARNRAALDARGEVFAFLDDDDLWRPTHLERIAAAFADPRVELAYEGAVIAREVVADDGTRSVVERRLLARPWQAEVMRENDYVSPSALAVRRAFFVRLGGFDESFRFSEDWDFLLRASRHAAPRYLEGIGAEVRLRIHGNASANYGRERVDCLERLALRHGLPRLVPRTFWEVAEVVGRPVPPED